MWGWVRMKLRLTYGVPIAVLALSSGAIPARSLADEPPPTLLTVTQSPTAAPLVQRVAATEAVAVTAPSTEVVTPPPPANTAPLVARPGKPPMPVKAAHRVARDKPTSLAENMPRADRHRPAGIGDGDRKIVQLQAVGPRQIGEAAWYGGRYVGRRTSSGERLDQTHATAAHRDLPLNSLVRVTNLDNGRSVIVRITDRGPVSESLLIDVSPKAADELAMKQAGIVRVAVEQVVEVPSAAK
jgi:rare lipoprotein A (peptidoglycan hydrolase)